MGVDEVGAEVEEVGDLAEVVHGDGWLGGERWRSGEDRTRNIEADRADKRGGGWSGN